MLCNIQLYDPIKNHPLPFYNLHTMAAINDSLFGKAPNSTRNTTFINSTNYTTAIKNNYLEPVRNVVRDCDKDAGQITRCFR